MEGTSQERERERGSRRRGRGSNEAMPSIVRGREREREGETEREMESGGSRDYVVGSRVGIKTTLGDEFEGHVLTFDTATNVLVLHEPVQAGPRCNFRLLKANFIKEFTLLSQAEDPLDLKDAYIDISSLKAREETAIRQEELEAERIGLGVSKEAQEIFDALSKTLPAQWDNTTIVVMNEVRVGSPYLPENVTGGGPAVNERVRKVLEMERKRLQARGLGQ